MIKDLKELEALLKLCRKQGITEIKLGDTEVKFGDKPISRKSSEQSEQSEEIPTDELTPEQLLYFSVGGEAPA